MTPSDKRDRSPLRLWRRSLPAWSLIAVLASATVVQAAPDDDGYELVRGPAPTLRTKGRTSISLSLVPRAGHRLLADAPVVVRLRATGIRPDRTLYQRDDAVDPRADVPRFELALTADKPGPAKLEADCTFYICKAARCRPVQTTLSWTFDVTP